MVNKSIFNRILFSAALLTSTALCTQQSPLDKAREIINQTVTQTSKNTTRTANLETFSEKDLLSVIDSMATNINPEFQVKLQEAKKYVIQALKDYKVTGMSLALDPNFAFIYDSQNPCFDMCYKDSVGQLKKRTYYAEVSSWGLKFQLALNLNLIFFTDTNFNFYDSDKTITLGTGIDVTAGLHFLYGLGVNLTYTPFHNAPGGIVMVSFPLFGLVTPGLSIVSGGSLTPCK